MTDDSAAQGYFVRGGILVRKWTPQAKAFLKESLVQVVIPTVFCLMVLKLAHDDLSGHLGVKKTYNRVMRNFFWPRLKRDVSKYIQTCHTCQVMGKPNQNPKPVPLLPIPAVCEPFNHLIVDCVGPLPRSKSGSEYLLTIMCQVTRYPAAFVLRSITAKSVIKALSQFMSVFGIPKIIQSDQGTNFTSGVFEEALRQLNIKHNISTSYHPQSQVALERFHQSLKSLLRAYCTEMNRDWEEGLPWLMLAARKVTQDSTGFSPNEVVFGHTIRGPLAVLRDGWVPTEPSKKLTEYVDGFRRRLFEAVKLAKGNLEQAQSKMKRLYDRRMEPRSFDVGDQVLALLPVVSSPFKARSAGLYVIL